MGDKHTRLWWQLKDKRLEEARSPTDMACPADYREAESLGMPPRLIAQIEARPVIVWWSIEHRRRAVKGVKP